MTKIITINQLINMFKEFSKDHLQLNDFGYGQTSEISRSRQMKFPYLWITHSQASSISVMNRTQTPEIHLQFIIADQINIQKNYKNENGNESNNTQEILSDTFQTIQDLVSYCILELNKLGVKLMENDLSVEPVMDETTDNVSGWSLALSFRLDHLNCIIPLKN